MDTMTEQLIRENPFSAAVGLHWYCVHYHGGQWSKEYRIMCEVDYRPGCGSSDGPDPEDAIETEIYRALEGGADVEAVHAAVKAGLAKETEI